MPFAAFNGQVQDTSGNAVAGVSIEVRRESDNVLVTIYEDRNGTTPLANPFTTSALDDGYFRFHVAGGAYRIRAFNGAGDVRTWRYVSIGLGSEVDDLQGPAGADGDGNVSNHEGAISAGQLVVFSDTSGQLIEGANIGDSPTTPFVPGGDAGVRAATAGHVIHSGLLESAAAGVALTDAATIAVDWDTFINGTVTLTANRTLGNPTNGQPGTWRTILVQGDAATSPATARSLIFGNQYLGDVPTLNDITDNRWYLLMIFCATTTHFVISAKRARGPASGT